MHNEFDNRSSGKLVSAEKPLSSRLEEIESAQTYLQSQLEEVIKTFKLRMDRMQLHMTKVEQQVGGMSMEVTQRMHQVHVKVNEQKKYDQKVEELMDRHTNLIKSYEVRIQHLMKIMSEKEGQIIQAQAALNEAKMEIARLKRI